MANTFNRGKAVLKPLEAAALGLPTLVSNVPPYTGVCSEDTGAIMVENTDASWRAALERMDSAEFRQQLAMRGSTWRAPGRSRLPGPLWAKLWGSSAMMAPS